MSTAILTVRPADNPFASSRIESLRFRCAGPGVAELARRARDLGGRVAIVGPEGSGKTTLLHQLAEHLHRDAVLVGIPGGCPDPLRVARDQLPRPVKHDHAVLLDGGEQLGPLAWRRFIRTIGPAHCLVATFHRPGRLPALIECGTDNALLRDLVAELAPDVAPPVDLDALFNRHRGNIRLCFRELYDVCAGRAVQRTSGERLS